ncbi:MAG: NAD-dependent epimerase/dehydratase family protein [Byssovorax sp.]
MNDAWQGRTVFITGASGLLGYAVARALLVRGARVRALCRGARLPGDLDALGVEIVRGDLDDRAALRRGMDGASEVFHIAADVRMWRGAWAAAYRTNVLGTRNLVEIALSTRPSRLVFTSSAATLGRPLDATRGEPIVLDERSTYNLEASAMVYPHTKWLSEQEVLRAEEQGLSTVITHPAAIFGPWDWKLHTLPVFEATRTLAGAAVPGGYRTVCDVRDVAEGHLAAALGDTAHARYAFGGHPMSLRALFTLIAREVGGSPPRFTLPAGATRLFGRAADALGVLRNAAPLVTEEMAIQSTLRVAISSAKAERELGYRARPAEESIRDAVAFYREQGVLR